MLYTLIQLFIHVRLYTPHCLTAVYKISVHVWLAIVSNGENFDWPLVPMGELIGARQNRTVAPSIPIFSATVVFQTLTKTSKFRDHSSFRC